MLKLPTSIKRKLTATVLLAQLFTVAGGSVLFPEPAQAVLGVGDVSVTAADIPRIAADVLLTALKQVGSAIKVTVVEVATYLGQKVAHDAAVQLVAGAAGQKPLFNPSDAGQYLGDLALDVGAQTLSGFTEHLTGLDICTFDPRMQLTIAAGFAQTQGPQGRRCDFKALSKRFTQIQNEVATFSQDPAQGFAARFSVQFVPGNSTLDGFTQGLFGTLEQVQSKAKDLKEAELLDRIGSIKPVKDPVTGKVKTPQEVLKEKIIDDAVKKPARDIERNIDAALQAAPEEILTIVGLSAKAFVSTLLGEATKKIYAGLTPSSAPDLGNPFGGSGTGVADARAAFRSLLAVQPIDSQPYDALGSFASCPQGAGMHRNPDTCVMDQQFAAAVRRGTTNSPMTVKEAVAQGFLRGDFPFIGPNDSRNQDPNCYLQGYCYSNLVKLRRARVISIGWEMAALLADQQRPGTTLAEVVNSFSGANLADFKGLIDPNWILKFPPTQCRQMVNGSTLLSDRTPNRHEVCVDTPSCIREDGNGNCLDAGYGYCTQEKNVWRFDGDKCDEQFNSCLSVSRPGGGNAAYLMNTLDSSACTSGNAGCRNYLLDTTPAAMPVSGVSTTILATTAGTGNQFSVPANAVNAFAVGDLVRVGSGASAADVSIVRLDPAQLGGNATVTVTTAVSWAPGNTTPVQQLELTGQSIYLNKQAPTCPSGDKGCTELVNLTTRNTPANLFSNPSFELDGNSDTFADGWNGQAAVLGNANDGAKSMSLAQNQTVSQYVSLQGNAFYTFSAALRVASGSGTAQVTVNFQNDTGVSVGTIPTSTLSVGTTYARPSFTFSVPATATIALITLRNTAAAALQVDALQVEYGETATAFHDGYLAGANGAVKTWMKTPPASLGCTGASTDDPECRQYAGVCSAADVGCERYTPTNGDSAVNGSLSRLDLCPSVCAGYDTFKQLGYDDTAVAGAGFERAKFPVFFSPTFAGARSCSVASAGCDEFTNLERSAQGGEAREYYSKLRKCQVETASNDTATYYTWEGSDTAGLQLKTWKLKKSNVDAGPCTTGEWQGDGTSAVFVCRDDDATVGVTDANFAVRQPTCTQNSDVAMNPDCREFYDDAGSVHYRLLSKTVLSADACTALRKTTVAAGAEGQADCRATGGRWTSATGECVYFALPSGSQMCNAVDNGCRAYRGNAGSNTRMVLNQTFETVVPSNGGLVAGYTGTYSNESLAANGHSLRTSGGVFSVDLSGALQAGKTYQISYWAKANSPVSASASLTFNSNVAPYALMTSAVTLEWQRFVSDAVTIVAGQTELNPSLRVSGGDFYVDNLEIREVQSVVAFVKNSWTVPASCDQTAEGASSPQEMLGCREYTDRVGNRVTARSFSRLCADGAVGCKAFADTQNSAATGQQIYNARCFAAQPGQSVSQTTQCRVLAANGTTQIDACQVLPGNSYCRFNANELIRIQPLAPGATTVSLNTAYSATDTVKVAADTVRYLIDDPTKYCSQETKGCYEFGAAQYSQDQQRIVGIGKKTLINLPDTYAATLCGQEANFCDAFSAADGSVRLFKDPEAQVAGAPTVPGKLCEYRSDVVVGGVTRKGWFRKGTELPCYEDFVVSGTFNGIRKNADPNYQNWGGACAPAMSLCTEFRDPTDTSSEAPLGKSYFFLKNDRVTSAACNQVSRSEGCAMFEDTTNPTKLWNAEASYAASDANAGALANAVSCEREPGNPACKNRCKLTFSDITGVQEPTALITTNLCTRNEDCEGMTRPGKRVTNAVCVDITNDANTGSSVFEGTRDEDIAASNTVTSANAPLNNANMLLRVRRDRECGEWLSCTTSSPVYDSVKQEMKDVCNEVRTCAEMRGGVCVRFVETERVPLTRTSYQSRDTSWKAGDLSGYTVPGLIPLDRISQVNVAGVCASGLKTGDTCFTSADCNDGTPVTRRCAPNTGDPDLRIAQKLSTGACGVNQSNGDICRVGYCVNNPSLTCSFAAVNSNECGGGTCSFDREMNGRCYDNTCVQLVGNAQELDTPNVENFDVVLKQPEALSCRAYPENDSPVAASVVNLEDWKKKVLKGDSYVDSLPETATVSETVQWTPLRKNPKYNGANVCSFAKTADGRTYRTCECNYTKATYGGATVVKYYPQGTRSKIKPYICSGGPLDGAACTPATRAENDPCGPEGQCTALQKIDNAQGVNGYCLQRDASVNINGDGQEACALWLPVDALPGSVDIYNQDEMAGFVPAEDDLYMCTESAGRSKPNKTFTNAPYEGTLVSDSAQAGIICQNTQSSCSVKYSQSACEPNGPNSGYCKWVDGLCKTYLVNFPELPSTPALPIGCGVAPPTNVCDFSWSGIFGTTQNPKIPPQWPTSNSCCIENAPDCPDWYKALNGGSCGAPTYKQCGSQPTPCSTPIVPPSMDILVDDCVALDKVIYGSVVTGLGIGMATYGPAGAALGGLAAAPVATIASAKCAELAKAGVCSFTQRFDRFPFTATNDPFSGVSGASSPLPIYGMSQGGGTGLRSALIDRANNINTSVVNGATTSVPADNRPLVLSDNGRVYLYGENRDGLTGVLPAVNGLLEANSIRKDEIAAIRVTSVGDDPQTNAVPGTYFLLPPNFEASFWWNGGSKDDQHRTDPGKALTFNSYNVKCGDNGLNCQESAKGKSCPDLFTDCRSLQRDISEENKGIENCAAIKAVFNNEFFNGTESGMCIRSNTHGGSLPVKIDVLLKESCNVATQVAQSTDASVVPNAVAFTDRVWSAGQDPSKKATAGVPLLTAGRGSEGLDPFYPYGVMALRGNDAEALQGRSVALYALLKSLGEGPFQPMKQVLPQETQIPGARTDLAVTQVEPAVGQPQGGYTYDDRSGNTEYSGVSVKGTVNSLKQMFAMSYAAKRWDPNAGGYLSLNGLADDPFVWDVRSPDSTESVGMSAPKVYPVLQGSCRPTDGKCQMDLAREGNITVNDRNDGALLGTGSMKATVKFYFEADKDHMPTKRIVVDWGDRTDTTDLSVNYGLYKNRVGMNPDGTMGCDGDTKPAGVGNFGRSSRGCEDEYISFSHTYTCDDVTYALALQNPAGAAATALLKGKPAADAAAGKCVFKPRVMVLDNWGWCNGVCSSTVALGDPISNSICYTGKYSQNGVLKDAYQCDIDDPAEFNDTSYNASYLPAAVFSGTVEVRK